MGSFIKGLGEGIGQGIGLLIVAIFCIVLLGLFFYWGSKSGFFSHVFTVSIKNLVGLN
jgi:hypothetical protein